MKNTKLVKFVLFLLFVCSSNVWNQSSVDSKYKLALTFERAGDYERAEEIFTELYNQNKENKDFFFGVVRCKRALNKFSDIAKLVEEQSNANKNLEILLIGAEANWKIGNKDKAKQYWDEALQLSPNSDSTYLKVSALQSRLGLFQDAISTLLLGRKKQKNERHFAEELIQLYIIIGDYQKCIDEILQEYERTNNLSWAQAKISFLIENKNARTLIEEKLKRGKSGYDLIYQYLYAWYLYSIKDYERALAIYKVIDEKTNSKGLEVYKFGNTALNDGQFDIATNAFEYVISFGKKSPYFTNALYGLTKATDAKLLSSGRKIDISIVHTVIKKYEDALKEIPSSNPLYFEIKYRLAQLFSTFLSDYRAAEQILSDITKTRYNQFYWKANLLLADINLFQYHFVDAEKKYFEVIALNKNVSSKPIEYFHAVLKLAKSKYYQSQFDSAQYYLSMLIEESPSEIASEALERSLIIEKFKQFNLALSLYAHSDLLFEANRVDSSLALLDEAINKSEGSSFEEFLWYRKVNVLNDLGMYENVEKFSKEFVKRFPKSLYFDNVLYNLGFAQYRQNKNIEAINTFTELITKFPRSIYNPKAREVINEIRKRNS